MPYFQKMWLNLIISDILIQELSDFFVSIPHGVY